MSHYICIVQQIKELKLETSKTNIVIVSKQLLDGYYGDDKINVIVDLKLDFIVFDESHFH